MTRHPGAAPPHPAGTSTWGIEGGHHDGLGTWRQPSAEVTALLRRAMGATSDDPHEPLPASTPVLLVRAGERAATGGPGRLVLEDRSEVDVTHELPGDLPLGYHRLERDPDHDLPQTTHVIVWPGRCHLPADLHEWGLAVQLYSVRTRRSWGIGDLADLRRLVTWATDRGAGAVALNPLHAPDPVADPADSPYSPSSRRWRNPLHLAVEAVPGLGELPDAADLVAEGRALNDRPLIDRSASWAVKRRALDQLWQRFAGSRAFDRYRAEQGVALENWARYCALVDHHGPGWRSWPEAHRRPDAGGVERFAAERPRDVAFWAWLQWLLDEQLRASGAPGTAIADLAVGIDPEGADAWEWQDLLALDVSIGAPPDELGRDGQVWGLPPFVPWRLRDAGYQPLAQTLRAVLRHAGGLRIDHVMGLFRLLWIPEGHGAADGAYVRFPADELLAIVALESARAGCYVIGEDLGTVEPGVRERLADAGLLSTRLLWFEDAPPEQWPHQAMAAVTTHDLPTMAGVWRGADLADQRRAGVTTPPDGDAHLRRRLCETAHCGAAAPFNAMSIVAHRRLAESPAMVVAATLDDLVAAEHRPNLPGTVDEHPNWRIPLPIPVDGIDGHPLAEAVASALDAGRGRRPVT